MTDEETLKKALNEYALVWSSQIVDDVLRGHPELARRLDEKLEKDRQLLERLKRPRTDKRPSE